MNKTLLAEAVETLHALGSGDKPYARKQAVRQFDTLLQQAKNLYPDRPDVAAIAAYGSTFVLADDFDDATDRLNRALQLRPPGPSGLEQILLPPDAPEDFAPQLEEFREAVRLGLQRTALLLAGSLAEALLLLRHPDKSDRGPGLGALVSEAAKQRLFGHDTLRQLETLNDYRDVIHTRAAKRKKIALNGTRIEHAVMAIKQLCAELANTSVKFESPKKPAGNPHRIARIEDFQPGQHVTFTKIFTEIDLRQFIKITGDRNPLHVDEEFAADTPFGRRVLHGMLTASIFSTIVGMLLPGTGAIYRSQTLKFLLPVHLDETVIAHFVVRSVDRAKHRLEIESWIENDAGEHVI